jgi:hypothetical protein
VVDGEGENENDPTMLLFASHEYVYEPFVTVPVVASTTEPLRPLAPSSVPTSADSNNPATMKLPKASVMRAIPNSRACRRECS